MQRMTVSNSITVLRLLPLYPLLIKGNMKSLVKKTEKRHLQGGEEERLDFL